MTKFFIYCRKSSEDEERQALSIESQLVELREYAKQNDLLVVKEFTESQTAKDPGRPVFNSMLLEIEKGNAQGILAWNPDRLARNSVDGGKIIYLVDTSKISMLKFPTFWFEPTPQGKFMLSVAFGQAKYYTDNLRENILRGIRQKLRRGESPTKAPLGYINEPRLRTIVPDSNFKAVKACLEAFAGGNYTLSTIQEKMFSLGLVGKSKKPLCLSTIQHMLVNPFYYGLFRYRGELHQGSHVSMISKQLFDQIQQALQDSGKPRKKKEAKKVFAFLNFLRCGECGFCITADRKVKPSGREYIYYYCTRKSRTHNCSQRSFLREEKLAEQVILQCQKVALSDEWRDRYLERWEELNREKASSSDLFAQNLRDQLNLVKTKIGRLTDAYLNNGFELSEYREEKNKLMESQKSLEDKLADFEQTGNHWLELFRKWILSANQAKNLAKNNDMIEIKKLLQKIGSNSTLKAGQLNITFKKPWNYLMKANFQARAHSEGVLDINLNRVMWTIRDSNP